MPTVPKFERTVEVGGLAAPAGPMLPDNASGENFGGGRAGAAIGEGFGRIGDAVEKVAAKEREKANDTATTDYYTRLAAKKQELFWGQKGVITKRGKDSFGAVDEYGKQFDEYADELEKGMTNEQLAMVKRIRAKERVEFDGQVMRHISGESKEYQDQTVKAGIMVARNDAVLSAGDLEKVQDKIRLQEAIYQQTASGKPAALVEAEMKEIRGKTHLAVISRMVDNGADLAAKSYMEKVRVDLHGETDNAEKLVRSGTVTGEALRQADQIMAGSTSMEAALGKAGKIADQDVRLATEKRLEHLYSLKEQTKRRDEENRFQAVDSFLAKNPDPAKVPRSLWNSLPASDQEKLEKIARDRREGVQPITNWGEYYNLKTMAAAPELRSNFMRVNLLQYRDRLADSEFKELVNAQEGLRKGDEKTGKLLDGIRTDQEIVNTKLKEIGIDPNTKNESDAAKIALFRKRIDDMVIARQTETNRKATSKEIEQIVDDLTVQVRTEEGWLWDTKARKFEVNPGQKYTVKSKDIPAEERAKIEQVLKRRKAPVTDEAVLRLYKMKVGAQ